MNLKENDLYYFDAAAADRVVNFIERYLTHFEDRWEGQPFTLLEYQRIATRDIFGWKRRDNNLRRFREIFALIGKGNGKSAWLSALACYMLLADGEPAAHVISAATDHKQADITFDFGKKVLQASPRLKSGTGNRIGGQGGRRADAQRAPNKGPPQRADATVDG